MMFSAGEGLESSPVVALDVVQDAQSVVGVCVVGRVLKNLLQCSACFGIVLQLVVESSKVGESICAMGSSQQHLHPPAGRDSDGDMFL